MRAASIFWTVLGLAYAAGAGWLLYDYYGDASALLRGRWLTDAAFLQEIWPDIHKQIRVSWLYDLRIVAIPVYVVLGLWIAERVWQSVTGVIGRNKSGV